MSDSWDQIASKIRKGVGSWESKEQIQAVLYGIWAHDEYPFGIVPTIAGHGGDTLFPEMPSLFNSIVSALPGDPKMTELFENAIFEDLENEDRFMTPYARRVMPDDPPWAPELDPYRTYGRRMLTYMGTLRHKDLGIEHPPQALVDGTWANRLAMHIDADSIRTRKLKRGDPNFIYQISLLDGLGYIQTEDCPGKDFWLSLNGNDDTIIWVYQGLERINTYESELRLARAAGAFLDITGGDDVGKNMARSLVEVHFGYKKPSLMTEDGRVFVLLEKNRDGEGHSVRFAVVEPGRSTGIYSGMTHRRPMISSDFMKPVEELIGQ